MNKPAVATSCTLKPNLQEAIPYSQRTLVPVSVIIVNWNAGDLLERCVLSLLGQSSLPHEIIVFDNASTDGSVKRIIDKFPSVLVFKSEKNLGFAAANNQAVKESSSRSEWLAFLNPDAFPESGWLSALLNAAATNPEYSFFGSRLMDASSTGTADGIGDVYHGSGLVWRAGQGKVVRACDMVTRETFSICAAAALLRKEVFLAVGGFDEDFFCYVEDVDLGFRLRLLGHKCLYVPDSVALHVGSAVTGKRSAFSIYHGHRNLVWAYIKNMPGLLFWLFLPLHLALNGFSIVYFSLKGQAKVIVRAKWDALKGISKMWRKRREIQSRRVVPMCEIWRMLDKRLIPMRRD